MELTDFLIINDFAT